MYVLRWQGRTIGFGFRRERREDAHGEYFLYYLSALGTSEFALAIARAAKVELDPAEAAAAMRVAAEACVVYELPEPVRAAPSERPGGKRSWLSPADFGYTEITPAWGTQ